MDYLSGINQFTQVAAQLSVLLLIVGAFFLGWVLTTYGILMVVRQLDIEPKMEILLLAAGTLLGVLVGILVVKYARPCIIWLMAVSGGMSIATGVCGILQKDSGILMLLIMAVCVPAGVLFQFMTTHK